MNFGATANGQRVNLKLVEYYVKMGFRESLVVEAVKQVNNDEMELSDLLTNPNKLSVLKTSLRIKREEKKKKNLLLEKRKKNEEMIENCKKMMELGFEEHLCLAALQKSSGNIEQAIIYITENDFSNQFDEELSLSALEKSLNETLPPPTNLDSIFDDSLDPIDPILDEEQIKRDKEFLEKQKREKEENDLNYELENELKEAVELHEGDYVNMSLEDEHTIFIKYKSLLESRKEWY